MRTRDSLINSKLPLRDLKRTDSRRRLPLMATLFVRTATTKMGASGLALRGSLELIRGSLSLKTVSFFLVCLLLVSSTHAFEVSENFWESGQAVFHVGIPGTSPTGGSWNDAFKRSMDAWSAVSSFKFIAEDEFLDPCIDRGTDQFGDGVTGVDFRSTVCGSAFGENTLAVTLTAGQCLNQQCTGGFTISDADIVFNSGESWDVYSGPLRFDGTSEFERVALHELGHALGLDHSNADSAIMRPFVSDNDALQTDDIDGVISIYGGETIVETTVSNIYGVALVEPDNATLSGPNDSVNLAGTLSSSDDQLDGKSLDLYQYSFENDSTIDIQLNSQAFDPFLYLVRVTSSQASIPEFTFVDDNSGSGNNARINTTIQAGTYWLGASSASNGSQGGYDISIISSSNTPSSSFTSFTSIYGVDVLVNPNPNIKGILNSNDFKFDGKLLDLIQFDVSNTTKLKIDLSSSAFDTSLLLVDVIEGEVGQLLFQNDDNGSGTNSTLQPTLQAGTYWLGVTSFDPSETGDYTIVISVVLP